MKKFKKTILALTTGCAVISAAIGLAACVPDDEHAHVWDAGEVTTTATCEEDGVKTFNCTDPNCSATKVEPVAATGHSWDNGEIKTEATCEDDGLKTFNCTYPNCDATKGESIAATGHEWGEWSVTKKPTSKDTGEVSADCTHAGCTQKHTAELPATYSIVYSRTEDDATCEGEGSQHFIAEIEGKTVEFDLATPPKGHVWTTWNVTEPTDAEEGVAVRTCAINGCGGEERYVLPVTGSADYEKKTVPATCETDGHEIYNYEVDADTVLTFNKSVPALGHDMQSGSVTAETKAGDIIYDTCSREGCNHKENPVEYFLSNSGTNGSGNLKALAAGSSYYIKSAAQIFWCEFDLTLGAIYEIEFEHYVGNLATISCIFLGGDMAKKVAYGARGNATINASYAGVATINHKNNKTQNFTFDSADYVGSKLGFQIACMGEPEFKMTIKAHRNVEYGSNAVVVTDSGSFADTYTFTPAADGVYSLTVPEGLIVLKDGEDFIIDGTWANFEAKAGEPVEFTFSHGTVGKFTVLVGDEIVPPQLTVGGDPITANMVAGEVFALEVGEDVEEETYTIEISGSFITGRGMGYGYLCFMVGGDGGYSSVTSEGLSMSFPNTGSVDGYDYDCSKTPWTVTLTLKAGDKVYFAPANSGIPAGNSIAPISIVLKAA